MTSALSIDNVKWPEFVTIPEQRVRSGNPTTSTHVVFEDASYEVGFWCATPGSFASARDGFSEFVTILSGAGEIRGDDGVNFALSPGVTVHLQDGWRGTWVINETLTKTYAIIHHGK